MSRFINVSLGAMLVALGAVTASAQKAIPGDVHPGSLNRLQTIESNAMLGVEGIRTRRSGVPVRWESALGRALTELAILTVAREHDQPYEWSLHEMEALAVGLDPTVIDVVRNRESLAVLSDKESVIVQLGREIFGQHKVLSETYARALRVLGETNLVDIVDLMGGYVATATRLTAFNQQLPQAWAQFLPLPFAPPDDIYADSRSRLPYIAEAPAGAAAARILHSRTLAPEGTGPGQIRRHGSGQESLEKNVGWQLMSLVELVTAREYDVQYQWTMAELAALEYGLEPAVINLVRDRRPVAGIGDEEAALIVFGRELFDEHTVSAETYARALAIFGETDLVDLVDLMAQHASDATLLIAFDQQLPEDQEPLLPIP